MSSIKLKGSSSGEATITTASDGSTVNVDKNLVLPAGQNFCIGATDDVVIGRATDNRMTFNTNGTERMRIIEDGKVGIGTSSPAINLETSGSMAVSDTSTATKRLQLDSGASAHTINSANYGSDMMDLNIQAENLIFKSGLVGVSERMRVDSGGTVLMGQTTNPATATLVLKVSTGSANGVNAQITSNTGTSFPWSNYNASGAYVGGISCTSSGTGFPSSSDYRLKENVTYNFDATTRLKQLKPCRFNFKIDTDNTVDGFLAHEVSDIVPQAIFGQKDAMAVETRYTEDDVETQGDNPTKSVGDVKTYSTTKIDPQSIDHSKLVPLLVKTIQEQQAIIEDLESRVTTLEG